MTQMKNWREYKEMVINLCFPAKCIVCGTGGRNICQNCFESIPTNIFINGNIISLYSYKNKIVNELLWKLKYHHCSDVAELFGKKLVKHLPQNTDKKLFLIPVPLNQGDKRLHNHAEEIANSIANNFPNKIEVKNILIKKSKKKQAHTKSRQERFENIKDVFSISSSFPPFSKGEENIFIILDDVTTTGATINEARKVISEFLNIKEKDVLALTVAH